MKPAAEASIRAGHPWVFEASIREQNRAGQLGELAIVYDRHNRFLAAGLFEPDSPIRVRILHCGQPTAVDHAWWEHRLEKPLQKRAKLFGEETTGFRWINGESDGWPGLVLDRYGSTLVMKVYSAAWLPRLDGISRLLQQRLQPERLVLRLSRNIQKAAFDHFALSDGHALCGKLLPEPVVFLENGLRFEADVIRGQKTGFFLDQRENRRRVGELAGGARVLNAFSFSGGFSVYAARGGARAVTDLDISPHALFSGRRNFELNRERAQGCARHEVQADAFEWLSECPSAQFDLVVLDPPSLARRESERAAALRAYRRLVQYGIRAVAERGRLVACSCSAHVPAREFFQAVRSAAAQSGRAWEEVATMGHAPDHPAAFEEAHYLKSIYVQLRD